MTTSASEPSIDFVVPWVMGSDPEWRAERARWAALEVPPDAALAESNETIRFREWDHFRYWFRLVERYAPWVRRIHLVTWGHVPTWLDVNHPKVNIVRHEDYIPAEYLPTFSSHVIELNLHRIEDLSEHFVYFNDDMFLTRPIRPQDVFRHGLPRRSLIFSPVTGWRSGQGHVRVNVSTVINRNFAMDDMRRRWRLLFSPLYRQVLLRNVLLMRQDEFPGLLVTHGPCPMLKSVFEEVWDSEPDVLDMTCRHKFRAITDVKQYLMDWWARCSGRMVPSSPHNTFYTSVRAVRSGGVAELSTAMRSRLFTCINDAPDNHEGLSQAQIDAVISAAFEMLVPEPSSFERDVHTHKS